MADPIEHVRKKHVQQLRVRQKRFRRKRFDNRFHPATWPSSIPEQRFKKLRNGKNDTQPGKKMKKNENIFPARLDRPKTKS
jgi:hypothetical protein